MAWLATADLLSPELDLRPPTSDLRPRGDGTGAGAKHLVLTHLIPPPGAPVQGAWKVPGGPITEASFRHGARDGGSTGNVVIATDLASLRLPSK